MASPRTRRILSDLRPNNDNTVSFSVQNQILNIDHMIIYNQILKFCIFLEMLRMWYSQPTMGECNIWNLDMFGVFRETSRFGSSPVVCPIRNNG